MAPRSCAHTLLNTPSPAMASVCMDIFLANVQCPEATPKPGMPCLHEWLAETLHVSRGRMRVFVACSSRLRHAALDLWGNFCAGCAGKRISERNSRSH